jgi:trans-2,3-dihydro-3-hydroxyanthranilate isomerase
MAERVFHIVDVFAEERYQGNQLAVFLDGHLYSDAGMQQLAKEMNFSETTFIFPHDSVDSRWRVRIFTPAVELPFAGHPTLGTAYIIARELMRTHIGEVTLDLNAGPIPVTIRYGAGGEVERLTMRQLQPVFGATLDAPSVAGVLGIPEAEIDTRYPIQEVSTGVPFLMVPIRRLATMQRIRVDPARLGTALAGTAASGVLVFCPETYDPQHRLNVRVFVPEFSITEDPATGSANGCLVAYLLQQGYLGAGPVDLQVEQGFELGRNSILYLSGEVTEGHFDIRVGGQVQHIAQGTLRDVE